MQWYTLSNINKYWRNELEYTIQGKRKGEKLRGGSQTVLYGAKT